MVIVRRGPLNLINESVLNNYLEAYFQAYFWRYVLAYKTADEIYWNLLR